MTTIAGAAWTTRALHLQDDPDYVPEDEDDDEDDEAEDDEEDDGDDDDEEVETWQVVSRAFGALASLAEARSNGGRAEAGNVCAASGRVCLTSGSELPRLTPICQLS